MPSTTRDEDLLLAVRQRPRRDLAAERARDGQLAGQRGARGGHERELEVVGADDPARAGEQHAPQRGVGHVGRHDDEDRRARVGLRERAHLPQPRVLAGVAEQHDDSAPGRGSAWSRKPASPSSRTTSPRVCASPPTTAARRREGPAEARTALAVPLMVEQRSERASAFAPPEEVPAGERRWSLGYARPCSGLLLRHRVLLAVLVTSTLIAAVAAKLNTSGNLQVAAATDPRAWSTSPTCRSSSGTALSQDLTALQKRAELYSRLIVTPPVLDAIARRAGVPRDQISGVARTTADVPIPLVEPGSEERASQIRDSRAPYRLELQSSPASRCSPIYAAAPTTEEAQSSPTRRSSACEDYLRDARRASRASPSAGCPTLRQLGAARGGLTNGKARIVIAGLTFFTAFALSFVACCSRSLRRRGLWSPPRPAVAARCAHVRARHARLAADDAR